MLFSGYEGFLAENNGLYSTPDPCIPMDFMDLHYDENSGSLPGEAANNLAV